MPTEKSLTQEDRVRLASQQRREQEKVATRTAILQAAAELFLEQGYEGFSLRKLAERLGYSATNLYHYFTNKDDLLFTLVDDAFLQFAEQLAAASESTQDPLQRLQAIAIAYLHFGLTYPAYYQLMFMQHSTFLLEYRQGTHEPRIAAFRILKQTVQQAIDAGVVRFHDALHTSNALWAMCHGLVAMAIHLPQAFDAEKVQKATDVMLDVLLDGIRQH